MREAGTQRVSGAGAPTLPSRSWSNSAMASCIWASVRSLPTVNCRFSRVM
jgi:hypothetical protein